MTGVLGSSKSPSIRTPIRAARLGLNTAGIAEALNIQFKGITATQFRDGDDTIPVIVRSKSDYRHHPERLPDLPVFGSTGGFVPLGQVANISVDVLPGTILRKDTLRQMVIKGRVRDRFASEALADIQPLVADLISSPDWPSGYTIAYGGEQEDSAEAQGNIGKAMPVAFAILSSDPHRAVQQSAPFSCHHVNHSPHVDRRCSGPIIHRLLVRFHDVARNDRLNGYHRK